MELNKNNEGGWGGGQHLDRVQVATQFLEEL